MHQGRTLLIVDDNEAMCAVLAAHFRRVGPWTVVLTAGGAGDGMRLAEEHEPDAIVLDNRMPGGDGVDMLSRLRATCPHARIVMHTITDTPDVREAAIDRGVDAFVPKGHPLEDLVALLG